MTFLIGLVVGLFVGCSLGVFVMAVCNAAKEDDRLINYPETFRYPDDGPGRKAGSSASV